MNDLKMVYYSFCHRRWSRGWMILWLACIPSPGYPDSWLRHLGRRLFYWAASRAYDRAHRD